jgi:hypothetical protein
MCYWLHIQHCLLYLLISCNPHALLLLPLLLQARRAAG